MEIIRLEDIKPNQIALDNDGVVYPLRKPYVSFINFTTGSNHDPEDIIDYQFIPLGLSPHQLHKSFLDFHAHKISTDLPPYASAIHFIDLMHAIGVKLPVISSRDSSLEGVTLQSFARDFGDKIRPEDIHVGVQDKIGKMNELGMRLLVEDSYGNAKSVRDAGYLAILINHSYNKNGRGGIPEKDLSGIYRIYGGLLDIVDKVPLLEQAIAEYSGAALDEIIPKTF